MQNTRKELIDIAKHYKSFNDSAFKEFTESIIKELETFDWETTTTKNININSKETDEIATLLETLCSSCISIERAKILNKVDGTWEIMRLILDASIPTEELQAFKAQVPPDLMQKLLAAAQEGKKLTQADLQSNNNEEEEMTEEQKKGRELLHDWGRIRRACLGILRNALRFPNSNELKIKISQNKQLIEQLGNILTSIQEEGVNISYSCTILRFLLTNEEEKEITVGFGVFVE